MVKEWTFRYPDGKTRKVTCSEAAAREVVRTEHATIIEPEPPVDVSPGNAQSSGSENVLPWISI